MANNPVTARDITIALSDHDAIQIRYLRQYGWKYTCNMPGSFWLWRRDFSDVDTKRLEWWTAAGKKYSKPEPYGIITADTETAVKMTHAELEPRRG